MRIILRVLLVLVILLVLAVGGGYSYLRFAYPKAGPVTDFKIENPKDSALVERGKYLATRLANCVACHTPRKLDKFALPYYEDSLGVGGMRFDQALGLPGIIYSRNITSDAKTGIGSWSDAQIYHTITTGVNMQDEPLFPIMPYPHYARADAEDMKAIIAYLRTLKPIQKDVPAHIINFPVSLFIRMAPKPAEPARRPDEKDSAKYGEYLVNLGSCADCHSPRDDKGQFIAGMELAGGNEFKLGPMGTARAANITPDPATGIGSWSEEAFVNRFKFFAKPENRDKDWRQMGYQTVMPWPELSELKESDLRSIYQYLRTLKPVNHQVAHYTPAS